MNTNDNQVLYPMTFNYVSDWGLWESVRELVSNAHDASPDDWSITHEGDTLIIRDSGDGIQLHQLLLGVSEKTNSGAIGQFGEGMKLALMVLLRLGHNSVVYSNDLILTASRGEKFGREVLVITHEQTSTPIQGTCVVIDNWEGETFQDRFLFDNDDDRIIFTNEGGSVLDTNTLFNKGVFVQDLPDYAFGYNMPNLKIDRDRSTISEWDIQQAVGKIWRNAKSSYSWKMYFQQVKLGKAERDIYLGYPSEDVKDAIRAGFLAVYGNNACLETSDDNKREAAHRGATIVNASEFGYNMRMYAVDIVKTDEQYIAERGGIKPKRVKPSQLDSEQKRILAALRRMAKKVGCDFGVEFADIPHGGVCYPAEKMIRIHVNHSHDLTECQSVMIHELAHAVFNTEDVTDAHVDACCKIGALLIN